MLLIGSDRRQRLRGRQLRLGAARRAGRVGGRASCSRSSSATNDDDTYTLRVIQRIARRQGGGSAHRRARASSSSRSTGSRCRCCGARCATATRRTWRAGSPRARTGWSSGRPTSRRRPARARPGSCSARTRTSPRSAGSRRRPGRLMACSAPDDCAEIERRARDRRSACSSNGGASRGNLLSGEADEVILTVSRIERREAGEPRLPRVLRQRLQRHARARALLLGGRARVDGRAARRRAATCGRAATAAASTRSCARRCASSSAT